MPRKSKRQAKRKPRRKPWLPQYRPKIATSIQMANLKPSTIMVRFEGHQKYQCFFQSGTNNKSILRVPASFMADPVVETGTWSPDTSGRFVGTTDNFYQMYNHYKVAGAQIQVTVKKAVAGGSQQLNNLVFVARVTNTNTYSSGTGLDELYNDYAIKSRQWGGYTNTGYRQAYCRLGYSPKKQLAIKDIADNGTIKVSTGSYGLSASDNTFFNVILSGELDQETAGHGTAIVDVKCSYLIRFEEPTKINDPVNK